MLSNNGKISQYLKFSALGLQMAVTLFILAYLGRWIDEKFCQKNYLFTAIFLMLGLTISLLNAVISLKKISKKSND